MAKIVWRTEEENGWDGKTVYHSHAKSKGGRLGIGQGSTQKEADEAAQYNADGADRYYAWERRGERRFPLGKMLLLGLLIMALAACVGIFYL